MHDEAMRYAIAEYGPRISDINGMFKEPKAAFYLTKKELNVLFSKNGFNTNGVSWLKMIIKWGEVWEELIPSPNAVLDKHYENWAVYFRDLSDSDRTRLQMYGENNNVPIFPKAVE